MNSFEARDETKEEKKSGVGAWEGCEVAQSWSMMIEKDGQREKKISIRLSLVFIPNCIPRLYHMKLAWHYSLSWREWQLVGFHNYNKSSNSPLLFKKLSAKRPKDDVEPVKDNVDKIRNLLIWLRPWRNSDEVVEASSWSIEDVVRVSSDSD
jgi:hypothetical protein